MDDDGEGLSDESRAKAMLRGVRLDSTGSGAGLGLAIAQDIVDAYGGELGLSTSPLGDSRRRLCYRSTEASSTQYLHPGASSLSPIRHGRASTRPSSPSAKQLRERLDGRLKGGHDEPGVGAAASHEDSARCDST